MRKILLSFAAVWLATGPAWAQPPCKHDISSSLAYLRERAPEGEWTFAVLGDSRNGMNVLAAELRRIKDFKPAFVINTGDIIGQSTAPEWEAACQTLAKAKGDTPFLPVAGNHETYGKGDGDGIGRFLEIFGNPASQATGTIDYTFEHGGARFIMLDNSRDQVDGFTTEQLTWLERQLQNAPPLIFVTTHKPPATSKWRHAFWRNSAQFMQLLEKYQVTAALFGHIHLYDRLVRNGVNYFVTGGAGAPLYHWDGSTASGDPKLFEAKKGLKAHNLVLIKVSGKSANFQVYTDEAKLTRYKPQNSSDLKLDPADFLLWDAGALGTVIPKAAAKPAG
ncbi:MAG: metallophosphoesterase, partial [Cyanobacteria bacterium NC_groundwater_1444_Ag_S-0.65um_54_12]|nr:metallophosphoesterase [Cyanobacteria bacterium NC_groundwater_1444_Ag_S-0.65um_54_12]